MGEISIVRSRHEKLQSELSLLRQKEMEKERKWKEEVERLKKENEIERNNLRVQGVFERHGNETQGSRRGWWPQGSAMKSTSIPGRRGMNESPRTHLDEVHQMTPSKNGKGVNPRSFYSNSREGERKGKLEMLGFADLLQTNLLLFQELSMMKELHRVPLERKI